MTFREFAPAKINLALHVTGQRADGYHLIDTLVVFADVGDVIEAEPADKMSLTIDGPFASNLSQIDNLMMQAAQALQQVARVAGTDAGDTRLHLTKSLPVASGIGGGSADAAAALRALNRLWGLNNTMADLHRIGAPLGADVPMCLSSTPLRATGTGDIIAPISMPALHLVLVNPGISVATTDIFVSLKHRGGAALPPLPVFDTAEDVADYLRRTENHLERLARALHPEISTVLEALRNTGLCPISRMSGSGATCFGMCVNANDAAEVEQRLKAARPDWWCVATQSTPSPVEEEEKDAYGRN